MEILIVVHPGLYPQGAAIVDQYTFDMHVLQFNYSLNGNMSFT